MYYKVKNNHQKKKKTQHLFGRGPLRPLLGQYSFGEKSKMGLKRVPCRCCEFRAAIVTKISNKLRWNDKNTGWRGNGGTLVGRWPLTKIQSFKWTIVAFSSHWGLEISPRFPWLATLSQNGRWCGRLGWDAKAKQGYNQGRAKHAERSP